MASSEQLTSGRDSDKSTTFLRTVRDLDCDLLSTFIANFRPFFSYYVFFMWYILKATYMSDSSTPKTSHIVSEIDLPSRQTRSDKPDTFYFLDTQPKKDTDDEYFSLDSSDDDNGALGADSAIKVLFDDTITPDTTFSLAHERALKLAASLDAEQATKTTTSATALVGDPPKYSSFDGSSGDFVTYAVAGALSPPLDISTVGELPAIIVDASIDALESSSATTEGGFELVDLSAIDTVDVELGSVVSNGSSATTSSGPTVVISDVPLLETSSAPYISSGLTDAVGITETDATGELITPGASAAIDTALLHIDESETIGLAATGGTHTDNGFEVVVSDTETNDTDASDPLSDPTPSADVVPPTATVDSVPTELYQVTTSVWCVCSISTCSSFRFRIRFRDGGITVK